MKLKIKYFEGAVKLEKIAKGNWIDVYANKTVFIPEGATAMIPLGFALELPKDWEGHILPRSSTFKTWGLIQTNMMGVVDDTYIGDDDQWHMPVYCLIGKHESNMTYRCKVRGTNINSGDKIGQFRIMEVMPEIELEEVEHLGNENRGGFGTTGTVKIQKNSMYGATKEPKIDNKVRDIIFDTMHDVTSAIKSIEEIVETYSFATLADLYDLSGLNSSHLDTQDGFTRDHSFTVASDNRGFFILTQPIVDLRGIYRNRNYTTPLKCNEIPQLVEAQNKLSSACGLSSNQIILNPELPNLEAEVSKLVDNRLKEQIERRVRLE